MRSTRQPIAFAVLRCGQRPGARGESPARRSTRLIARASASSKLQSERHVIAEQVPWTEARLQQNTKALLNLREALLDDPFDATALNNLDYLLRSRELAADAPAE